MLLNLDSNFKPLDGEEIPFESFIFSGGEPHIKINPNFDKSKEVTVTHRLNSFNDLGRRTNSAILSESSAPSLVTRSDITLYRYSLTLT